MMDKTTRINTPGGTPGSLVNPPSSEDGPKDSGGDHLLLPSRGNVAAGVERLAPVTQNITSDGGSGNPFYRSPLTRRTPPTTRTSPTGSVNHIPMMLASAAADIEPTQHVGVQQSMLLSEFTPTTPNEINLWNEWQRSVARCNSLQATLEELQKKVEVLMGNSEQLNPKPVEYFTDEEELARETEGIVKKKRGNKKRKATSSPATSPQQITPVAGTSKKPEPKKTLLPPPINIVGIQKYESILRIMQNATIESYKVKLLNGVHKVNVYSGEEYHRLQNHLKESGIEHYTYEDKNTRPIKVIARGVDPSCTEQMIEDYLTEKKFAIQDVVNIQKKEKKGELVVRRRLPLFMLVFHNQEDIKRIYDIKNILGIEVKIEPLRKRSALIPQCKRCQGYGHTQNNCFKVPRCVKCAGKHKTSECVKPKTQPAKCANCNEAHPANYRGCIVAKELQKIRNDAVRKQRLFKISSNVPNPKTQDAKLFKKAVVFQSTSGLSYAQVAKGKETKAKKAEQEEPDATSLMLQKIMAKLDQQVKSNKMILERLNKLESGNKKAATNKRK